MKNLVIRLRIVFRYKLLSLMFISLFLCSNSYAGSKKGEIHQLLSVSEFRLHMVDNQFVANRGSIAWFRLSSYVGVLESVKSSQINSSQRFVKIEGYDGCNRYSGLLDSPNKIKIGQRYCDDHKFNINVQELVKKIGEKLDDETHQEHEKLNFIISGKQFVFKKEVSIDE